MQIIGVDHVQFAVPDVGASVRYLTQCGYRLDFQEAAFNVARRSYFRGLTKTMAYMRHSGSRIEVITSDGHPGQARYVPVLDGLLASGGGCGLAVGGRQAFWHEALCSYCLPGDAEVPTLTDIVVRVAKPEQSTTFWQLLGFRQMAGGLPHTGLGFAPNMFSMPLTVHLLRVPFGDDQDAKADDPGCSSVALISRDLCADRAALAHAGHRVSEATAFHINGRAVTICFISGPSGELVELVEFGRS